MRIPVRIRVAIFIAFSCRERTVAQVEVRFSRQTRFIFRQVVRIDHDKSNPIVSDVCGDVTVFAGQQVNVPGNFCNVD